MSFGDELRLVDADSSQQHRKRMYLAAKVSTSTLLLVVLLLAIILLVDSNCCCAGGGGLLLPQPCACCNGGGGLSIPGCNCGPLGLPGGGCSSCCCNCPQSMPVNLNPIACICQQNQNQCPPGLQFPNQPQPNPQPNPQPQPAPQPAPTSPPVMIVSACEPCCSPCGGGGGGCAGGGGCCGGGGGCAAPCGGGGGGCVPACAPAGGCCAPAGGSICIQGGGGCCVPACNPCAGICNPGCQCACCNSCCGPTPLAGGAKLHCCPQACERKFYLCIPMKVRQCLMPDTNCYDNVIKNACSCNNQCPPGLQIPNGGNNGGVINGGGINGGGINGGGINGGSINGGGIINGNKTTNGTRRRIVYDYIDIDEVDEEDLPKPKKKKKKTKTKKTDATENITRLRRQTLARFDFLDTGVLNKTVANEFGERVRFKYAQVRNQFTHAIFSNKDKKPHGYTHMTTLPPAMAMPITTTTHQAITTRKWKPIFANAATSMITTTMSSTTTTATMKSTTTIARTTTTAEESLENTTNITPPPVVRSPGHISFGNATVLATEKPVLIHAPVKGIETPDTAQNIHQSLNPLYDKRKDLSEEEEDGQKTGKAVKRRIGRWKRKHGEVIEKSLEEAIS